MERFSVCSLLGTGTEMCRGLIDKLVVHVPYLGQAQKCVGV
jgi:hypothetical protein